MADTTTKKPNSDKKELRPEPFVMGAKLREHIVVSGRLIANSWETDVFNTDPSLRANKMGAFESDGLKMTITIPYYVEVKSNTMHIKNLFFSTKNMLSSAKNDIKTEAEAIKAIEESKILEAMVFATDRDGQTMAVDNERLKKGNFLGLMDAVRTRIDLNNLKREFDAEKKARLLRSVLQPG